MNNGRQNEGYYHVSDCKVSDSQVSDSQMSDSQRANSQLSDSHVSDCQLYEFLIEPKRATSQLDDCKRAIENDSHLPLIVDLRNKKKLQSYPHSMVHSIRSASCSPISPISLVTNVRNIVDCIQACVRSRQPCHSASFIKEAKMCLFSDVSVHESHFLAPLIASNYVTLIFNGMKTEMGRYPNATREALTIKRETIVDDNATPKAFRQMPKMQKSQSCGRNSLGFGPEFDDKRRRKKRIVNGWTPRPYDVPWVGVMFKNDKPRCTVALVSKGLHDRQSVWGITAKHCVQIKDDVSISNDRYPKSEMNKFAFIFGVHDIKIPTMHETVRKAKRIFSSPDEGLCTNDLALIKFNKPIKFTGYINGLCLPDYPISQFDEDLSCFVCGWGATNMKKPRRSADVLKCIEVIIRLSGTCNSRERKLIVKQRGPDVKGPFHHFSICIRVSKYHSSEKT
uniref:Peptidase S1 domain-containing protein n=1 Tax=Romanomermis culicivorax TaxID=13658 RepID=A0A915HJ75_ROMCU